jgi:diguanylate cyclase (GGDEF)-like protein/putative nucleotidyltransferase with HDIG domain
MEAAGHKDRRFLAKALWYTVAASAVFVVGISAVSLRGFAASTLIAIAIAAVVVVLIARHDIRIPATKVRLQAKDIFALWGVIWLGVPGGVLVGLAGSAAACFANRFNRDRSFLLIASDSISTFIVGSIYYFAFGYFLSADGSGIHLVAERPWTMAAATAVMGAGHFVIDSLLDYLGRYVTGEYETRQLISESFGYLGISYLITIVATLIANVTFLQFGLEFGLVILPTAVFGSIAYAVHRQRLSSKTKEISEASRIHLATVEALATAIDARDQLGIGHVRRTQIFAVGIGEVLGLGESDISALRTGALLHDIGKLAVPDHILNKTEQLTHAEAEKIKIHSSVGASILEKVGFDTPVVPTVKFHHENWDGSGYPEGRKGEHIPLTARILAVADAYDTMRGARPYRAAVSKEDACKYIRKEAGLKFDPRVVKIFLENLHRFEAEITRKGLGYKFGADDFAGAVTGSEQSYVEQIKRANREASTMYELAKDFSSSLTLDETLKLFTDKVREFVHFDTCSVYLFGKHSNSARAMFVAGKHAAVFNDHVVQVGTGITGQVLETKKSQASCDPWPDLQLLRSSLTTDYRAMISLPLLADEKLIGAVSLYSTNPAGYSEEHLRLVETISQIAADSIIKSQRHAETENNALTDPMTGLPNARSLQLQFEREMARAQRASSSFQVLMLDLDGFKQVNDTYGHKAGDKMLQEIGRIIKAQLREYDFLARYAGDEFVALIPQMSVEDIYDVCRRIENAVEDFELIIGDETAQVGVSIGWATYPFTAQAIDQLLIAADKEMYSTKSRRKKLGLGVKHMIPKPTKPLEFDMMPDGVDLDDLDTVVEIDEQHIYISPLS